MWIAVETPALRLVHVRRDRATQGCVFVAWPLTGAVCYVCQSLAALSAWLNEQGGGISTGSLYKVSRGAQRQQVGWMVERHTRSALAPLNERLAGFDRVTWLTRDPDCWRLESGESAATPP
jgi:hypothetical protein